MDDPLQVSVLHGLADRHEQLQAGPRPGAASGRSSMVIGSPLDELHHVEEGLAGLGGAAVVDAGDIGVVHRVQRLPLGVEPSQHRPRVHADLDQLGRHLPLDRRSPTGRG